MNNSATLMPKSLDHDAPDYLWGGKVFDYLINPVITLLIWLLHLFYSIYTGYQSVLGFILKSFSSPGKRFMTWHLLTSVNSLIFTIHHVNFALHIKTFFPYLGLSLHMATGPFMHVLQNSGTHFLQIYIFVTHWIFLKRLLRLTYLKLLMTVLRLLMVFIVSM